MSHRITDVAIEGSYGEVATILTVEVNGTHTVTYATNHGNDRVIFNGKRINLYRDAPELGLSGEQLGELTQFCAKKVDALHEHIATLVATQSKALALQIND